MAVPLEQRTSTEPAVSPRRERRPILPPGTGILVRRILAPIIAVTLLGSGCKDTSGTDPNGRHCFPVTDQPVLGPDGQPGPSRTPAPPFTVCEVR